MVREAGDPRAAPDDLEDLRRFVNSDDRYHGVDRLADDELRPGYFAAVLPRLDPAGVSAAGWRRLTALRAGVRDVIGGGDPGALTELAQRYPARLEFTPLRLAPVRNDAEHEIAVALLTALHQAVRDGRLTRLRLCERPDCGWCYYDGSRNGSARWCSADPCGDVMKTRAYRERQRQGAGG
jgi:CGNR zinc finger